MFDIDLLRLQNLPQLGQGLFIHPAAVVLHREIEGVFSAPAPDLDVDGGLFLKAVLDAVFQQGLKQKFGDDERPAILCDLHLVGEICPEPGGLDHEIILQILEVLFHGHIVLGVVDAVPQDADKPPDQLLGALRVVRDEIPDVVQGVIDKVGVDLGLEVLHLHPAVHLHQIHIALAQLLDAPHHLVHLMGDLLDLVPGVDFYDVVRVLFPDDPDLFYQGFHRLCHLGRHGVHNAGKQHRPADAQQQDEEHADQEIGRIGRGIDEGIGDHRTVLQQPLAAQIPAALDLYIAVRLVGMILVGVFLREERGVGAGYHIPVGFGEDRVVLVPVKELDPVVFIQIYRSSPQIFPIPIEGVNHHIFGAVGPEMVDGGIDRAHEPMGVLSGDAVEFLSVEVHLVFGEGGEPYPAARVGQDQLQFHQGGDIVLADEIPQIVLVFPHIREKKLFVFRGKQEIAGIRIYLMEGIGDAVEMVVPLGVQVHGIDRRNGKVEQETPQKDAANQTARSMQLQLLLKTALFIHAFHRETLHTPAHPFLLCPIGFHLLRLYCFGRHASTGAKTRFIRPSSSIFVCQKLRTTSSSLEIIILSPGQYNKNRRKPQSLQRSGGTVNLSLEISNSTLP